MVLQKYLLPANEVKAPTIVPENGVFIKLTICQVKKLFDMRSLLAVGTVDGGPRHE